MRPPAAPRRHALSRALGQMRDDPWLQGVAVSTLTVCLAIMGAYLALCLNLAGAARGLTTGPAILVVLQPEAAGQGPALARELASRPEVAQAGFVPRHEALERFRRQLGAHEKLLEGLERNPLPDAVEVVARAPGADLAALSQELSRRPGVSEVVSSRPWLQRLERALGVGRELALALGGLLFLGVVLVVMNTTRLAAYVRRHDLEVMELVGATSAYLRLPFLLEAVLQGLVAAVLASAVDWCLLAVLRSPGALPMGLDLESLLVFPAPVFPALAAAAVLAGLLGGLLGVGRARAWRGL